MTTHSAIKQNLNQLSIDLANYYPRAESHKRHRLAAWILTAYCALTLILFMCVADQALGHAGQLPLNATLLCLLLISPFTALELVKLSTAKCSINLSDVIRVNGAVLISFLLVVMISLISSGNPSAYWGEGGKWIALIPYGFVVTLSSLALGVRGAVVRSLPAVCCMSLLLLVGSIWYDTLHPGTFADARNRAAGFPGNANFAALVAVILCAVGLDFSGDKRRSQQPARSMAKHKPGGSLATNLTILFLTFAVVAMTMSRSGLVNFLALLCVYIGYRLIFSNLPARRRSFEAITLLLCSFIALSFVLFYSQLSSGSRLTRLLSNQRVDDGSAGTRLAAVVDCLEHIEQAPLFGYGTGYARTMHELPHNIYLQQWVNNGVFGLLAYLLLLFTALATFHKRGYRNGVALVIVATIGGLFSHNLLDQRPFLILFGILLAHSAVIQLTPSTSTWLIPLHSAPKRSAVHPG